MMSLSKKIFIASSTLLAFVLIFWGIYNLSFRKEEAPQSPANQTAVGDSANTPNNASSEKIIQVSTDTVLSPVFDKDSGAIKYLSKTDGKLYRIDSDGTGKRTLSPETFPDALSAIWSPDTSKIIFTSIINGKTRFTYYNFSEGKRFLLKENLDTASWIGTNRIAYKYYNPADSKRTVNISDPDGTNWSTIAATNYRDIAIAPIPQTSLVAFWNKPDSFMETDFKSAFALGTEATSLLKGFYGADYLWSPNGEKLLLSHSSGRAGEKMQLAITNSKGEGYKNLDAPTLISKCAWSKDNVTAYCALPGSIPSGAVLPNDYLDGKFNSADTFWKINTSTGEKSRIVELTKINASFDAFNLFLNSDESLLFFTNQRNKNLYKIVL